MNRIAGLFIALLVLSLFFWVVERLSGARSGSRMAHRRRGFRVDLAYWFTTPLVTRSVSQVGLGVILVLIYRQNVGDLRAMLAGRDTMLASQALWLQAIQMLVIGDFVGYWVHRAFHRGRLWRFHAVHHSSRDLDWLSSVRVHPVNDWVARWIQATALVVMGFSPLAVAAYVPFLTFYAIFIHANVSWGLGPFFTSPKFHRWHHTSEDLGLDKNFAGLLPVWDVIFGTYYMPKGEQSVEFGVRNEQVPDTYFGQLAYPFRRRPVPASPEPETVR